MVFVFTITKHLRQGGPGMKGSAAYPKPFAKKIMKLHMADTC